MTKYFPYILGKGKRRNILESSQKADIGTTAERITYAGNCAQMFFDTTLNKMVMYNGTKWVDMNGADAD